MIVVSVRTRSRETTPKSAQPYRNTMSAPAKSDGRRSGRGGGGGAGGEPAPRRQPPPAGGFLERGVRPLQCSAHEQVRVRVGEETQDPRGAGDAVEAHGEAPGAEEPRGHSPPSQQDLIDQGADVGRNGQRERRQPGKEPPGGG